MTTPRCFIVRHGETEWSLSGRHTGTSDIPLTADGERRVRATGKALVGDDRLIVPKQLKAIYVSPRHRAQRTLELLDLGCHAPYPWQKQQPAQNANSSSDSNSTTPARPCSSRYTTAPVIITDRIAEWNYGDYEGIKSSEIKQRRTEAGLGPWDIWRDGCPGGDSPEDVIARVDDLIAEIREKYHKDVIGKSKDETNDNHGDVLVVAHGHILRAFAIRWIGKPLTDTAFIMEAGGVGTLSYEHHSLDEPAIVLGGGFVVPAQAEKEVQKEVEEGKIR